MFLCGLAPLREGFYFVRTSSTSRTGGQSQRSESASPTRFTICCQLKNCFRRRSISPYNRTWFEYRSPKRSRIDHEVQVESYGGGLVAGVFDLRGRRYCARAA